ncbi:MAG: hypothetical protein P4L96_13190 [Rhodoferax sp.]|nr:hypothetical protein [Rhodoferax sp.]
MPPPAAAPPRPSQDEVLHSLYGAVGLDEAWTDTLRVLAGYFDASIGLLVVAGEGQRDQSFYAAWNHTEAAARAYSDHWWRHDVILQTALEKDLFVRGMIIRGSDLVPPEELRRSAFYQQYLSTLPAEHFMGCVMSDGRDEALAPPMHLSFFRPPDAPDFSDANLSDLAALYPHIHRAFNLHWQLRSTREQVGLFHQGLDGFDFGVVIIDSANRVRHANTAARQLAGDPLHAALLEGLPRVVPGAGALAQLLKTCALGQGGGAISLGQDDSRLLALALPLAAPKATSAGRTRASVVLMLIDPRKRSYAALDYVMRAFKLSRAEARLLPLLFENRTPAEMAQLLDVKIATVRTQLSAIFAKTGTTRQQELIRLLGSVPPVQRFRH